MRQCCRARRLFIERFLQILLLSIRNLFGFERLGLNRFYTCDEKRYLLLSSGEIADKHIYSIFFSVQFYCARRLFIERFFQFLLLGIRDLFGFERFGLNRFFTRNEKCDLLSSGGEIADENIYSVYLFVKFQIGR